MARDVISDEPEQYLRSVGTVFAEFGALTQGSGNVYYGVKIGEQRYFVKTAGRPDDPLPFLSQPGPRSASPECREVVGDFYSSHVAATRACG